MSFTFGDRDLAGRLRTALAEVETQKVAELAYGNATDFANYRERVGFVAGVRLAVQMIEETERAMRA